MPNSPPDTRRINAAALLLAGEPDAVALIAGDERVTYAALRERVMQAAAAWKANGIAPGDLCVMALYDGIDWVVAFLSLMWLGANPAPISPRTDPALIANLMPDSGARILLAEDRVAYSVGSDRTRTLSWWHETLKRTPAVSIPPLEAGADAPAFVLFSSGTTGKPKGVIHAHRSAEFAHVFAQKVLQANTSDRFFSTSKLFFAYPLANSLFAGLRLGATVILDSEWPNPERVDEMVKRHLPTLLFSVPTLYRRLLEAKIPFKSVRCCTSAGEACPPALAQAWEEQHQLGLVDGYGTTETLSLMLHRLPGASSVRPTPLTRVREEMSDPGDPASGARLWFSHPAVALGYSHVVTHDSARFGENEFSPGDVFRRNTDDTTPSWNFAGRSDQLLKIYGRWVDTVALEQWLLEKTQREVSELSIVPDDSAGTTCLLLFVVPRPGAASSVPALLEKVCGELPAFKRPAAMRVIAELPRTETGKVRRGVLKSMR